MKTRHFISGTVLAFACIGATWAQATQATNMATQDGARPMTQRRAQSGDQGDAKKFQSAARRAAYRHKHELQLQQRDRAMVHGDNLTMSQRHALRLKKQRANRHRRMHRHHD